MKVRRSSTTILGPETDKGETKCRMTLIETAAVDSEAGDVEPSFDRATAEATLVPASH